MYLSTYELTCNPIVLGPKTLDFHRTFDVDRELQSWLKSLLVAEHVTKRLRADRRADKKAAKVTKAKTRPEPATNDLVLKHLPQAKAVARKVIAQANAQDIALRYDDVVQD